MSNYKKEQVYDLKKETAKLFGFRCFVCLKRFGKGFLFHHKWYIEGEPVYKNFKDPLDYQLAVIPIVKKTPKQFYLLCHAHHHAVETLKRFKIDKYKRLLQVVKNSRY